MTQGRQEGEGRMSLLEHLTELRKRLTRAGLWVVVLGVGALVYARDIFRLLMRPVLASLPPDTAALVYTSAIEEINVYMKIGFYGGVFLATPFVLGEIWGFVKPGLYPQERKYAGPFIFFGTLAFLGGAAFCYFAVLPSMFKFLLQQEDATVIEARLERSVLREEDALRLAQLGQLARAAELAKATSAELGSSSPLVPPDGGPAPSESYEVRERLGALGRLFDAVRANAPAGRDSQALLTQVIEKRLLAGDALGRGDLVEASRRLDEASGALYAVLPERRAELLDLWRLSVDVAQARAQVRAINWTRPMLKMSEQLTLVLVLELAFGFIFELPLVMAVLAMVGIIQSRWLWKYQRHAFVVVLIIAAILTPTGDPVNLALMAIPMFLCYELGVLLTWFIERSRRRAQLAAQPTPSS